MIRTDNVDRILAELEAAVLDESGEVRPIRRIEFELLDSGRVRWMLWEKRQGVAGGVRWKPVYTATTDAEALSGSLAATKMVFLAQPSSTTEAA